MTGPIEWIAAHTEATMEFERFGTFATRDGRLSVVDPLSASKADFVDVPKATARLVVFYGTESERESKLALVYRDEAVHGGSWLLDCPVDAGVVSPVTPSSFKALLDFVESLDGNPYDAYFARYDKAGNEGPWGQLPDGTRLPYIHSVWGDGTYPVFALWTKAGDVCAVYVDFHGIGDEDGTWLTPPGVAPR